MEEIEKKFMTLVKEQHDRTGGSNGLLLYKLDEVLGITYAELFELVNKLIKEKKIAYLNHLNGTSYTLPK